MEIVLSSEENTSKRTERNSENSKNVQKKEIIAQEI